MLPCGAVPVRLIHWRIEHSRQQIAVGAANLIHLRGYQAEKKGVCRYRITHISATGEATQWFPSSRPAVANFCTWEDKMKRASPSRTKALDKHRQ